MKSAGPNCVWRADVAVWRTEVEQVSAFVLGPTHERLHPTPGRARATTHAGGCSARNTTNGRQGETWVARRALAALIRATWCVAALGTAFTTLVDDCAAGRRTVVACKRADAACEYYEAAQRAKREGSSDSGR
jgi:hypothetical protein